MGAPFRLHITLDRSDAKKMDRLMTYHPPAIMPENKRFTVRARTPGGVWQELFVYEVKVDMHDVRRAAMACFDMEGTVEVEVAYARGDIESADIRPLSYGISFRQQGNVLTFLLNCPRKLSIEVNGDRFHNLHLFANGPEVDVPDPADERLLAVQPGLHRTDDLLRTFRTQAASGGRAYDTLYFAAGMHYLEETVLRIPSQTTVYLAAGAIVVGSLVCNRVHDVAIRGRGMLYLGGFERFSAFRGVRLMHARDITIEGITTLDPPHYSIYAGRSERVRIRNFKSFSTRGWSDGIDMMACSDIEIDDVFLRTSDDCIAIYGSRWDYRGDARRIRVSNSVLWADVAHPMMIGAHGDHEGAGDTIEDVRFENIDVLEHHEPQPDYQGVMAINAGDRNTVRNVVYENIRVEPFENGRLFDIRVVRNEKYNPEPGARIEDICFRNIQYRGECVHASRIYGYDANRVVDGVLFDQVHVNGNKLTRLETANIDMNPYAFHITFR